MSTPHHSWKRCLCATLCITGLSLVTEAWAGHYKAFSLIEAQRQIQTQAGETAEISELGGITRPVGCVHDENSGDVIVVGECQPKGGSIKLDDLVVAMRSMIKRRVAPLVSIDRTPETPKTGQQTVRFEGGIENTAFGVDLLEADEVLKQLGLGKLSADVWGLRSYFDMSAEDWRNTGRESAVMSRFWFKPDKDKSFVAVREGVAVINKLHIRVETQVMAAATQSNGQGAPEAARDEIGERFAATLTEVLPEAAEYYPAIGRLDPLFRLTGLAEGIRRWQEKYGASLSCLDFWLDTYSVTVEHTMSTHPLLVNEVKDERDGKTLRMQISGGVELKPYVRLIEDIRSGSPSAFKELVLASRPTGKPLTWDVPLGNAMNSVLSEDTNSGSSSEEGNASPESDPGTSLQRDYIHDGVAPVAQLPNAATSSPGTVGRDLFGTSDALPKMTASDNVGGVMLRGVAKVAGGNGKVDLTAGDFSLIVDGENARLSPEEYRRFVTALWAVYYSSEDPGISIDPIAPGVDKHMVRYIGNVVNSDLGRVMREADYLMKKWAVGTEHPDVPGFQDVDDLSAQHGLGYLGASRRFWFVPEDMTFRRGGEVLLFDAGRMAVKTEYVSQGIDKKAAPSDEAFASFFTEHYGEIAKKHPVFNDLFDYAKLVSLAKYLKEQRVPLFWFLMATKELVLTEDSPGTVDALAKGSRNFEGVRIEGGVDLVSEGRYVLDESAMGAVQTALGNAPPAAPSTSLGGPAEGQTVHAVEPFSFKLRDRNYSVLPQHTLTSGKDTHGIRYQTDFALWQNDKPGLEVVRYFRPGDERGGEFGRGWHLLLPYRVKPVGNDTREFLNAVIPVRMAVTYLPTGREEILTFSEDRYSIAGYVPDTLDASTFVGLFLMSDGSFRLADKIGNEFCFDGRGFLTDMLFSEEHQVHIEYLDEQTSEFGQAPYAIAPAGTEKVSVAGLSVPRQVIVSDKIHGTQETLALGRKGNVAGYVPQSGDKSRFSVLVLLTDGSYRLVDRWGNNAIIDRQGAFRSMAVSGDEPIPASIALGNQQVRFRFTIAPEGRVVIAEAVLNTEGGEPSNATRVAYRYDETGRLSGVDRQAPLGAMAEREAEPKKEAHDAGML